MNTSFKVRICVMLMTCALSLSSCIIHEVTPPGPPGKSGNAFYGVDFEIAHPYSYWDNNPAVPYNPNLGFYYQTPPGIFEFEYYVNPIEFWYGTYQIWVNPGSPGRPYGEPGFNGLDSYLMLICTPDGYYEYRADGGFKTGGPDDPIIIEKKDGIQNFRITLYKGDPALRKTHEPKYVRK